MSLNFLIFFSFYIIILLSILGYGYFLISLERNHKNFSNFGYVGILGIFFLIIYSYISNIFIAHSKFHNLILIISGLISFSYFLKKNLKDPLFIKNLYLVIAVFLFLFISLLMQKNHDDFPYYHFAYTFQLTQDSLNFGIGKLNHGFRTPSSIFYLNSLFFLPFVEYYLFNFASIFILGFVNIIFLKRIFFIGNKEKKINFTNYLSLLSLIFINIFFYRLSEHGTDRSAQILIFALFIHLLENFQKRRFDRSDQLITYTILGLIISLKSFYFLYLIFFIPFFIFVLEKENNFISAIKFIFYNKNFVYLFTSIFFVLFVNFTNTGCLLYPVVFTCFENFQWALPLDNISKMNDWYELWSKAGATPNLRVENPSIYITGFNWVDGWIDRYFFNKVSDFLIGLFLLVFIFFVIFYKFKRKIKKIDISKFVLFTYLILITILFEWFYNHPALRYGGYSVITLLIFIPFSFYLDEINISFEKYSKIALILVLISFSVFEIRNYTRIVNEINKYGYKPFNETFYSIDKKYLKIQKKIENLKNNDGPFSKTIF